MARVKIDEKHKAIQVCITLRPGITEALDECRKPWQSRSAQIREIIEAYLTKAN
jgi:metal-responsive CopG/Arc/MetJ family transcriptional regulator